MKFRHLILIPLLTVFTACAGGDKFPYPAQFVDTQAISMHALPAPPAPGSREYTHEIDSILARQAKLTAKEKALIAAEDHIAPTMIVTPVLGKRYSEANYPALYTLLRHAASDAWRIGDATQDYWQSPRPWYADRRVQLYVSSITRPGYPSGHTVTTGVWAYILSDLFPQQHDALFARVNAIGQHRVEAGAHFPHDIVGGKKLAGIIYKKMQANPHFQRELAAARQELEDRTRKVVSTPRPRITETTEMPDTMSHDDDKTPSSFPTIVNPLQPITITP